jgi:cyclophilin family peptidyl-prolyl cis-trans isomerase/HEAT repeat protein
MLRLTARRVARVFAITVLLAPAAGAQTRQVTRADVIRAEDARGNGPAGIEPIVSGLGVPALRQLSIRAIGRLERPDLVAHIVPFLSDARMVGTTAQALAQSLQGLNAESMSKGDRALVDSIFWLLRDAGRSNPDWVARGAIARSIGRLPFDANQAREADVLLASLVKPRIEQRVTYPAVGGVADGLYTLARARRTIGALSPEAVSWLRSAAMFGFGVPEAAPLRRTAWLALTANGTINRQDLSGVLSEDPDAQVRRLAVVALPNVEDPQFQREQLQRTWNDRNWMVRYEVVRMWRQLFANTDCAPLLAALSDSVHHVRLAAIDALGGPCPERDAVVQALLRTIEDGPTGVTRRTARGVSWHARAHALLAMARVDPEGAQELLRRDYRHPVWQVRMYVARAATVTRDSTLLTSMALDSIGSVREVAIQGLSATLGHLPDLVYVRALSSKDYHVVMAAARALRGSRARDSVVPGLLDALDRITKEKRQTSRDPRMELLARVRELADSQAISRLTPLLSDVDQAVAREAASVMNHLHGGNGNDYTPSPPPPARQLAVPPATDVRVRITMAPASGGGAFEIVLNAADAPMTVARVSQLIRNRYYDGLTWHRVVPNFVLQGGSPGMNEYVGDGPFMRDELGPRHHDRFTLGISTRGRDTGDAQWFINLVDNHRLDDDYTIFARVVSGFDVVDRILEGDVMQSVRIVQPTR